MSRKQITGIILVCVLMLYVPKTADARSVWRLSPAAKSLQAGQTCKVCFVTDPDDAALYLKHKDDIAKGIVQAILNYNKAQ